MNHDLYGRSLLLQVDDFEIENEYPSNSLRVTFDIRRDNKPYPNDAKVEIYNLSPNHRDALEGSSASVRLEAGYKSNRQQIFFGALWRCSTTRKGPDFVTTLELGDGEQELKVARINKSFAKGTPVSKVLDAFVDALGLGSGNVSSVEMPGTLEEALTLSGPLTEELQAFCSAFSYSYSIQDGVLQFLPFDAPFTSSLSTELRPDTGLIGEPCLVRDPNTKKNILTAVSLLQPQLLPGAYVKVSSSKIEGSFAVRKSRAYGDTEGGSWYVEIEATEV